jgi:hypothetical protein
MDNDKTMELLLELSNKMSAIQRDVEYLKSEMHSNYIRSDENDSAVRDLLEERTKWASNRQDAVKAEMQGQINLLKKSQELNEKQLELMNEKIQALENKEIHKVMGRWEQIKDAIFKVGITFIGMALMYYVFYLIQNPPIK